MSACASGQGGGVETVAITCSKVKNSIRGNLQGLLQQLHQLLNLAMASGIILNLRGLVLPSGSLLAASSEAPLPIGPCAQIPGGLKP